MKAVDSLMELAAGGASTRSIAAKLGTHAMRVSRAPRAIEAATGRPLRDTAAKRLTVDQIERQLRTTRAGAHPAAWGEAIGRLHRW